MKYCKSLVVKICQSSSRFEKSDAISFFKKKKQQFFGWLDNIMPWNEGKWN